MEPLALAAHLLPCMMPRNSTMFSPAMANKAFRRSRQAVEISSWRVIPLAQVYPNKLVLETGYFGTPSFRRVGSAHAHRVE